MVWLVYDSSEKEGGERGGGGEQVISYVPPSFINLCLLHMFNLCLLHM